MSSKPVTAQAYVSTLRTVGSLSISLGLLDVVWELRALVQNLLERLGPMTEILGGVGAELAAQRTALALRALVMLAMSAAVIIIGAGLRVPSERFRVAAVIWSEVALAVLLGRVVLWEAILWPHMERANHLGVSAFGSTGLLSTLADFVGSFLLLARFTEYIAIAVLLSFPVTVLVMVGRRRVPEECGAN